MRRLLRLVVASAVALLLAAIAFLSLQAFPLLKPLGGVADTVFSAGVAVLADRLFGRLLGGSGLTASEIQQIGETQAREAHRLQEQSKAKERLDDEKRKHHRLLVESFFSKLPLLRIRYYPRSPFRLYLDVSTGDGALDPRFGLDSLTSIDESREHLKADEYEAMRNQFDQINSLVDSFNEEARTELGRLDLEGKLSREFPKFRVLDPYFPRSMDFGFYYLDSFMEALAVSAKTGEVSSLITWATDPFPWAKPCGVLSLNGIEIARSRDKEELEKFHRIFAEDFQSLSLLVAKRDKILSDSVELQLSLRDRAEKMLEDYRIRKWLFGRCKIEDILEDQERVLSGGS